MVSGEETTEPGPVVPPQSGRDSKGPAPVAEDQRRQERLLVVYQPLVGKRVTAFLYDGAVFEGTLDSFVGEDGFALILRMATMLRAGKDVIDASIKVGVTFEWMNIRFDDLAELKSKTGGAEGGIGTDSGISAKKGSFGRERELQRWAPPEGVAPESPAVKPSAADAASWDQFAANERLFGLKTDFDEEMYTTKLDRSAEHIRMREADAERLAREIMSSPASSVHLSEERGKQVDLDEEALYGAVLRDSKPAVSVPPSSSSPLPPGFASGATGKPAVAASKLNVNACEFIPSNMVYYKHPVAEPAPQQSSAASTSASTGTGTSTGTSTGTGTSPQPSAAQPSPSAPSSSRMNPNAAAFYMPPTTAPYAAYYNPFAQTPAYYDPYAAQTPYYYAPAPMPYYASAYAPHHQHPPAPSEESKCEPAE